MAISKVRKDATDKVDDRYYVQLYNPAGGLYKKVVRGKKAARDHEAEMRTKLNRGGIAGASDRQVTVEEFLAKIMASKKTISENTRISYGNALRNHVIPNIGGRRVVSLARESLLLTGLFEGIERDAGKGMRRQCEMLVRMMLKIAIREGVLDRNPLDGVPLAKRVPVRGIPYAPELVDVVRVRDEILANTSVMPGSVEMALAQLDTLTGTGMRVGELMGLSEADVDWDNKTITINRQVIYVRPEPDPGDPDRRLPGVFIFGPPKTDDSSVRTIPAPQFVMAALAATKLRNGTSAVTLPWERRDGKAQTHQLLFFSLHHGRRGEAMSPNHFTTRLSRLGKRLELSGELHAHCLRHRYTTTLHDGGVPQIDIDYVTGHRPTGSITLTVYTQTTKAGLEKARRVMEEAWAAAVDDAAKAKAASGGAALAG